MTDDQSGAEKSGAYWFRIDSAKFLAETGGLKPSEVGTYVKLLAIMHLHAEPIPDDMDRLARRVGTDLRTFKPAREALIDAGLIFVKDGLLWSPLIEHELERFTRKSKTNSENASAGHKKRKQNQRQNSAVAYKSQNTELDIDPQAPGGPEESYTSHSPLGGDAPARSGAGLNMVRVNDELTIPGVGECWVTKIVSVKPYHFVVETRDDYGNGRAFRVDRQLRFDEISLSQAGALPDLSGEPHDQTA